MLINQTSDFSGIIKNRRKSLGITQVDLATALGLQQKTISAIEKNSQKAKAETIVKILKYLKLNIEIKPHEDSVTKNEWDEEW